MDEHGLADEYFVEDIFTDMPETFTPPFLRMLKVN